MKPILIRIQKKTVIASPDPKYDYRIIFAFIHKIDYPDSEHYFKHIGNSNVGLQIETDAQFAKYLLDNFGTGKYAVLVWRKGRQGFSYFYFDCEKTNVFKQIRKRKTTEDLQTEQLVRKMKKKLHEKKLSKSDVDKESLQRDIDDIKEDAMYNAEFVKMFKTLDTKRIAAFKQLQPVYKEHEYEDYGGLNSDYGKKYDSSIW